MKKSLWWVAGGLLLLGLGGMALYLAEPLLHPRIRASASLDSRCNLHVGPCSSRLPGGGRVSLSIEPRSIPVVKPIELKVEVSGRPVGEVEVDFSGVHMNMGFNRVSLQPQGKGLYSGTAILPVCVRGAMEWEAKVLLHTEKGLIAAPFRFTTGKPGIFTTPADG